MKVSSSTFLYFGFGLLTAVGVVVALLIAPPSEETPETKAAQAHHPSGIWHEAERLSQEPLGPPFDELKPIHKLKRAPDHGDWLQAHDEPPQTWADFHEDNPQLLHGIIFVQPLGEMSGGRGRIVAQVADYMHRFFGLEVRLMPTIPLSVVPTEARRTHPRTGQLQLKTSVLESTVLLPRRPPNAAAYVVFTAEDLFPQDDWNFVFGEAFQEDQTGLWSLARYGNPDDSAEAFHLCLARAMNTAVHETAHLFGLDHCHAYECVMDGANSLEESDRQSALLCPLCLKKLTSVTGQTPAQHFEAIVDFLRTNGFRDEAIAVEKELSVALKGPH